MKETSDKPQALLEAEINSNRTQKPPNSSSNGHGPKLMGRFGRQIPPKSVVVRHKGVEF